VAPLISLVLPYFNRQEAANAALELITTNYPLLNLEVVVVDDGSKPPFEHGGFNPDIVPVLRVVRLPEKDNAQATCVPINAGVEASSGDIIALSGVEMLHHEPILEQMRDELMRGRENTYVSAAVWCREQKRWHAHTSMNTFPLHFMTMFQRSLWDRVGGMDPDYRGGICFDDNDFVQRLLKAEVEYVIRDDLIVEHPRTGAKAPYTRAQHDRNRKLFKEKWPEPRCV
jgi:glycosyltransferase involved in cell wall biosynthesis